MLERFALLLSMFLFISTAHAEDCIRVSNARDDSFYCMKISQAQKRAAASYGLRVGEPYERAKAVLRKDGWVVDEAWLKGQSRNAQLDDDLICGSGWNAVCSTAYKRGHTTIYLVLSKTNVGTPLVSVGTNFL